MIPTKNEANALEEAKKLIKKAGSNLVWRNPILALPWARVKNDLAFTSQVPTWAINCITGQVAVNPQWTVNNLNAEQCQFAIGHELLHVLLNQFERATRVGAQMPDGSPIVGLERNHRIFWESADRVINQLLVNDKVGQGVNGMLLPEADYDGPLETEAYYFWALKKEDENDPKGGQGPQGFPGPPSLGQGCAPQGKPGKGQGDQDQQGPAGEPIDWGQVRREAEAAADQARARDDGDGIGKGSSIAEALKPKRATTDWRKILPNAFDAASAESMNRIHRSYSRASRRSNPIDPNIMLPGKVGGEPTIAVVFDVSSSVSRELVAKAMGQCLRLAQQYPTVSVFVASHTSECVYSGWLKKGGDVKELTKATDHQGGTDCTEAYRKVAEAFKGRPADVLVHFTDTEIPSWPEVPARRTVIGACGLVGEPYAMPPNTKHVKMVPIDVGDSK